MSEELLEVSVENEVLAELGDVVVSLEREPDPNEALDITENQTAQLIEVDFGAPPDLSDHMAETELVGVEPNNVVIFAPSQGPIGDTQGRGPHRLHSDAGTANRTEIDFSTKRAA